MSLSKIFNRSLVHELNKWKLTFIGGRGHFVMEAHTFQESLFMLLHYSQSLHAADSEWQRLKHWPKIYRLGLDKKPHKWKHIEIYLTR